jgi:hypothetical protein
MPPAATSAARSRGTIFRFELVGSPLSNDVCTFVFRPTSYEFSHGGYEARRSLNA